MRKSVVIPYACVLVAVVLIAESINLWNEMLVYMRTAQGMADLLAGFFGTPNTVVYKWPLTSFTASACPTGPALASGCIYMPNYHLFFIIIGIALLADIAILLVYLRRGRVPKSNEKRHVP